MGATGFLATPVYSIYNASIRGHLASHIEISHYLLFPNVYPPKAVETDQPISLTAIIGKKVHTCGAPVLKNRVAKN